jgi:hypothetical protein
LGKDANGGWDIYVHVLSVEGGKRQEVIGVAMREIVADSFA